MNECTLNRERFLCSLLHVLRIVFFFFPIAVAQSRPAGENCFVVFAFMHGRRIKDDEVITRCYCIRVRTTTSLSRKSPHCCQLAASLFLSFPVFPLHDRIISDDDATCRWRDDTFLEKIESSSHPSVIIRFFRVLQTRVRPLRIPRAI